MGTYHQLTEYQRYQIYALKKAGQNQQRIAETLRVSPSTICRELRRNRGQRGYRPGQAHQQALARRRTKAQATKMTLGSVRDARAANPVADRGVNARIPQQSARRREQVQARRRERERLSRDTHMAVRRHLQCIKRILKR